MVCLPLFNRHKDGVIQLRCSLRHFKTWTHLLHFQLLTVTRNAYNLKYLTFSFMTKGTKPNNQLSTVSVLREDNQFATYDLHSFLLFFFEQKHHLFVLPIKDPSKHTYALLCRAIKNCHLHFEEYSIFYHCHSRNRRILSPWQEKFDFPHKYCLAIQHFWDWLTASRHMQAIISSTTLGLFFSQPWGKVKCDSLTRRDSLCVATLVLERIWTELPWLWPYESSCSLKSPAVTL